ncbi:MAG: hypothetical protein F4Y85_09105 [Gammaproteobacteria bacterium]|nr:hypothetical protein [Gammaproteobacteria bacterium]
MQVYIHQGLDPDRIPNFAKLRSRLEAGDFRSAEARKVGDNLFRARLDRRDRVLFSFARYAGETCILVLEHIPNHDYAKSRFLRLGETVDEVDGVGEPGDTQPPASEPKDKTDLAYVPEDGKNGRGCFHVLDKVIFLDDAQHDAFSLAPPFIVVGSAGSGKTVLVLEKLKQAVGDVLYVTRSPHLADRSREAYCGLNYGNDDQEAGFLSYGEFLETIRVPPTREVSFAEFSDWFSRYQQATGLKDAWRAFEEFGGVITGNATDIPHLSLEQYEGLGVKRSIYPPEDRGRVHALFLKYLSWLQESGRHDVNLLSHEYLDLVGPAWDFIVIDEAQDFTNVQLELVLKSLRDSRGFVLCGDANQIVHPNFFSWSALKTFLYFRRDGTGNPGTGGNGQPAESRENARSGSSKDPEELIRVLTTNYRNSRQVTETANRILRLKHARFGSVDRESNFLVNSHSGVDGGVLLLPDTPEVIREIDGKTNRSARHAVVVLHPEQKAGARERFRTPLVFTIQEAKGLEYDHVILYGFVSGDADRFREIVRGVEPGQVQAGELEDLRYARARDKGDRSLEIFKFHVNALYVAITRAVRTVYLVEPEPSHRLFDLLGVFQFSGELDLEDERSSLAEWSREARKLERQGKAEQAADIRERLLGVRQIPWEPLDRAGLDELDGRVADGAADRKSMLRLYEYALLSRDRARLGRLMAAGFRPALAPMEAGLRKLVDNYFTAYSIKHTNGVRTLVEKYGPDHRDPFNCTPLMLAARFGHEGAVEMMAEEMGADPAPVNTAGLTAFQVLLQEISLDERRRRRGLERMYRRLCPADASVMVGDRLVKLDGRKAEFLFFQLFVALFATWTADNTVVGRIGLRAADLEEVLERLPDSAVPAYRKKRPYISSVLARSEVDRDLPANRRIFRRTERGMYILNPRMSVRVEDEWVGIYDLLDPEILLLEPEVLMARFGLGRPDSQFREIYREHQEGLRRRVMECLGSDPGSEFF